MKPISIFYFCIWLLHLLLLGEIHPGNGSKILSLSFFTSRSQKITYDPLLKELAKRGHEVTVVSSIPSKSNSTNPREILTSDISEVFDSGVDFYDMRAKGEDLNPEDLFNIFENMCANLIALPRIQELLKEKFDLIFYEPFFNECAAGLVYKFNTSVVLYTPFSMPSELGRVLGGPSPPSFIPSPFTQYDNEMNFLERFWNLYTELRIGLLKNHYFEPRIEAVYRKALNDPNIPGVQEILKNSSLTLSNSHLSLSGARPFLPDVIEVGGMHMRETKPLPKDLEDFVQSSGEHGFIFFSMGTVVQSSNMPYKQRNILLTAFSKLKQKILWKWETDSMPDLPANVKLIKWAPQQDILGHPKCRAFITHGGLGGTTEAIYKGVPLIGIPMFADQHTNIRKFMRLGVALRLEFMEMTEQDIINTVETVLNDPKYTRNVKELSTIFRDQKDHPLERAVYWIEYVLRHKGAVHLRSPARKLGFFQYNSLDVISVMIAAIIFIVYMLYVIVRGFYSLICGILIQNDPKISKSNRKKDN